MGAASERVLFYVWYDAVVDEAFNVDAFSLGTVKASNCGTLSFLSNS